MTIWPIKKLGEVMKKQIANNNTIQIPVVSRNGSLVRRLLPVVLCGFDGVLDKESGLYLRLLVRLVDKSFDEYMIAREYLIEEIKTKDKLAHRFNIVSHLENCLNAINRAIKIVEVLTEGVVVNKRRLIKEYNILKFVSAKTLEGIKQYQVSSVRNRVEHIDEDIYKEEFKMGLFLDVDDEYKKICISGKYLSLSDLASTIENYHNFVLEIFSNLPNRCENGVYYYDKK
jgi:hypothetical protein